MASQEIQGKYFLFSHINNVSYTLTGNDRAANFGITGGQSELLVKAITANDSNAAVVCNIENDFIIKRVKLEANGGPGIQTGVNHFAAQFDLQLAREDNGNFIRYDQRKVNIPNWGEWYDLNLVLRPYKKIDNDSQFDFLGFSIDPATCSFYVDDYNIQSDYIGQGITPHLFMEVEAPGLYLRSNGKIF